MCVAQSGHALLLRLTVGVTWGPLGGRSWRLSEAARGEENKGGGTIMRKGKQSKAKERGIAPSLPGLNGGSGCTWTQSLKSHLLGSRWQNAVADAVQEASSNSERTLFWRAFIWVLYFAHLSSRVCACLHTCAHRVMEIILKGRRDHHGLWFTTNVYHPARWKATCPARYRRYWMLRRMSLSAGVIRFFHSDPNAFFQSQ